MTRSAGTVFLAVPHGFAARYLLHTDIYRTLHDAGARIVILSPSHDDPSMAAEFAGDRVTLEPLRDHLGRAERSKTHFVVSHVRAYALAGRSGAFRNKYDSFRGRYRAKNAWLAGAIHAGVHVAWRSRAARRALLRLEGARYAPPVHGDLFERHRPDLVVTTSTGYLKEDGILLREAAARGIPSVAVVLGWDNPTSKGYRGAEPGHVVAWSERMAEQVAEYQDFPRRRIVVGGVAHFDPYVRPDGLMSREELFAALGLDPERRLILYATSSPGAWAHNATVAETIATAIADGSLGVDAQQVVRVHPNFFRARTAAPMEPFERLAAAHPHVHVDVPGVQAGAMRVRLDRDDALRLGALIKHADVLVNLFSTTTVEGCLLDTPVVQVHQQAYDTEPDERFASGRRETWDRYIHMRRVVERGAARTARSPEELVAHLRAYLADPSLDRPARLEAARVECGPTDGHAGERIGAFLLGRMGAPAVSGAPLPASPPPAAGAAVRSAS